MELSALPLLAATALVAVAQHGVADLPAQPIYYAHQSNGPNTPYDIERICADGSRRTRVHAGPDHEFPYAVDAHGGLYLRARVAGNHDIYYRAPDGVLTRLTDDPGFDSGLALAPDGVRSVVVSERDHPGVGHTGRELYLYAPGQPPLRLTDNQFYDETPAWSPDGQRIAFTRLLPDKPKRHKSGDADLFVYDLAEQRERRLLAKPGYDGEPNWAPDGRSIAFHNGGDLHLLDLQTEQSRALTNTPDLAEYSPRWSPDGQWIVYTAGQGSDGDGGYDLWLMRADGSEPRRLTAMPGSEAWPVWGTETALCARPLPELDPGR